MRPKTISDILFKQEFRSWREVQDAFSSQEQGYVWMHSFFDEKDRATLLQIDRMRLRVLGIVWHETEGKVTSSPAASITDNTKKGECQ